MFFKKHDGFKNGAEPVTLVGGITVVIILILLTWVAVTRDWFPVWDYLNLIFHEAGHWILGMWGKRESDLVIVSGVWWTGTILMILTVLLAIFITVYYRNKKKAKKIEGS